MSRGRSPIGSENDLPPFYWGEGWQNLHSSNLAPHQDPDIHHNFAVFGYCLSVIRYALRKDGHRRGVLNWLAINLQVKVVPSVPNWGGDIIKAKLPDRFLVDYVRVYDLVKKETLGSK